MWKIGHRGACGYVPENTLLSMRKALEFGVHGIEFDIQLSREGEPVVIHDDTLERTTNGKGLVSQYSLPELQKFDAGEGEIIPSLRNIFDLIDKRCRLFIELKAAGSEEAVCELIKYYIQHEGWTYEQIYLCAFDHNQIAAARKILPELRTCALFVGIPVSLAAIASEAGAWGINPNVNHMSPELMQDAKARGLKVIGWTANQPAEIEKLKQYGVDGIIGNYPDRL